MSSMSYCVFANTNIDLTTCLEEIENEDKLSESEQKEKAYLLKLCRRILEASGETMDDED
jgi:hypothetical protein